MGHGGNAVSLAAVGGVVPSGPQSAARMGGERIDRASSAGVRTEAPPEVPVAASGGEEGGAAA